ncbi:hypothetical protein TCSYLVIO_002208 [Trypanosoma cruzi]|nr:hypothetical protein TCSYLVIO_002208 [Trypanosoma cruzi]
MSIPATIETWCILQSSWRLSSSNAVSAQEVTTVIFVVWSASCCAPGSPPSPPCGASFAVTGTCDCLFRGLTALGGPPATSMHSTRCQLRCVGAWGCCACGVPSAQRLRSTCTHPSSKRAASAGRIASVTSQWVAAELVLPRRSSECYSRGGIMALTRSVSSTLLVFLIAIALRVHIPLSSKATGHGSTFRSHHTPRVPSSHRAITRGRTRTPSQQPSRTRTSSCTSLQEPTGRRAHGQSLSQTVESPNAAEPTCDSTRKTKGDTAATPRTATNSSTPAAAAHKPRNRWNQCDCRACKPPRKPQV